MWVPTLPRHGISGVGGGGEYSPPRTRTWDTTMRYGRQAGGTHPAVMLSCLSNKYTKTFIHSYTFVIHKNWLTEEYKVFSLFVLKQLIKCMILRVPGIVHFMKNWMKIGGS